MLWNFFKLKPLNGKGDLKKMKKNYKRLTLDNKKTIEINH